MPKPPKARRERKKAWRKKREATEADGKQVLEAYEPEIGGGTGAAGAELEFDESAYDCFAAFALEWPCLSVASLPDDLGSPRTQLPHTALGVAGTQARSARDNSLAVFRLSGLDNPSQQPDHPDDADGTYSENEEGEDEDEYHRESGFGKHAQAASQSRQSLHARTLPHHGGVNRVRCMHEHTGIVAAWSDTGTVSVYDVRSLAKAVAEEPSTSVSSTQAQSIKAVHVNPLQCHSAHACEGYALGWSRASAGKLASGDCNGKVFVWEPDGNMSEWFVRQMGQYAHNGSVEECVWSPVESNVLATVGTDQMVHVWDSRENNPAPAMSIHAHANDINVADWSALASSMLATGCEDGSLKVWDLRSATREGASPVALFQHHRAAVTGLQWANFESSVLATCSADNQVCFWDLSVERDEEEERAAMETNASNAAPPPDLPPQLMFVHRVRIESLVPLEILKFKKPMVHSYALMLTL